MYIIIGILVVYMIGMLAIGIYGKRYTSNTMDFLTAARQGSLLLITATFMGSHIGNGVVVGGAEYGAVYGIGGMWYGVGASLSYILFAALLSRKVYKGGYLTISGLLQERYGGRAVSTIFSVLVICAAIGVEAGQMVAGYRLFEYVGLNPLVGAVGITLIVLLYSSLSGQWGVLITDAIQVGLILITTIAGIIYVAANGGFELMTQNLSADSYKLVPFSSEDFVMMLVPATLFGLVSATNFQRTCSAKNEKVAAWGAFLGGVILIPFVVLPVILGMYGRALFPDAPSGTILFKVLIEAFPPVLSGLMISSILAAVMSTIDSSLISITATLTTDIYKPLVNPNADDAACARLSKLATFVIGVIVLFMSLNANSIISLLSSTYSFLTAGGLVMVVGAFFWKKGTAQGAVASTAAGMFFVALDKIFHVPLPYASVFPLLPSLIAYVVVSYATQPKGEAAK